MEEEKIHHQWVHQDDEPEILRKILETQKATLKELESIKRSLLYFRLGGILKFLFIITPLIFGIIYLPSIIQNYLKNIEAAQGGISPLFETFRNLEKINFLFSN